MSVRCQVLIDQPADGAWNMALDEALLNQVAEGDDSAWLRFYQWKEPTLSLGYFQPSVGWRAHVAWPCVVVRRQSGGGAILHDRELTYSLVLPPGHPASESAGALYDLVHHALIAAIGALGVQAQLYATLSADPDAGSDAFYCFQRRSPSDVVVRGASVGVIESNAPGHVLLAQLRLPHQKICGSAQRRRKGAVLMHGSLLLESSALAPQIVGIKEVTSLELAWDDVCKLWCEKLIAALGVQRLDAGVPPERIRLAARRLADDKYSDPSWTTRR